MLSYMRIKVILSAKWRQEEHIFWQEIIIPCSKLFLKFVSGFLAISINLTKNDRVLLITRLLRFTFYPVIA